MRPRRRAPRAALAAGGLSLAALLFAAAPAAALDVLLRSPRPGKAAFGEVTIEAEVLAGEPIAGVEFRVDGEVVGRLTAPPWRLTVDLGETNLEHLFEVTARTASGAEASARVATPKVRVDDAIDLQLQQLYVTVTGGAGYDLGIGRAAFRVLDHGDEQTIVTFERGDAPLTAVLLLDTSTSMRGERLETAIEGARVFLDGLRELDEAKLTLFADRRLHAAGFSRHADVLTAGLAGVEATGGTALNDHLYYALRLLEGRQGRRVVIVLSDGIDVESALGADDVRWAARRSQAMIYWIRLRDARESGTFSSSWRSRREHAVELATLERTVVESGGAVYPIATVDGAEAAFRAILTELRSQYVLGYYPSRNRDDGSWHPVSVVVSGGYQVRTRDGYIDY
jgi:Ca-activated chloride channel family protein